MNQKLMTFRDGAFRWLGGYETKDTPKQAGFRWDPIRKCWWTKFPENALRLRQFADAAAMAKLAEVAQSIEASRATDADIEIPAPTGCEYLPFQRAGIAFGKGREAVLVGDEMGLGKTIQAIGIVNVDHEGSERLDGRILIVCPATLKINWKREIEKWLVVPASIGIATGDEWPDTQIVIANYDILHKHEATIRQTAWSYLIADEVHWLKSQRARRTQQVLGLWDRKASAWKVEPIKAKRRIFLTGTPLVNRPIELWPILNYLDPKTWGNFFAFAKRYTQAHHNGYGWDFRGSANLEELQTKLRGSLMIRRLKADVLKELPRKRRQVITIAANGGARALKAEWAAYAPHEARLAALYADLTVAEASDDPAAYKAAAEALSEAESVAFSDMSRTRHEVAKAKLPYIIEQVRESVDSEEPVVVFAHHKDIVAEIAAEFGAAAVTLTGDSSAKERQAAVDRFQTDPTCMVFIGTIGAAGVGLTLTRASTAIFAELDWVPGNVSQAEDRLHRIGQTESVLIKHIVLDGSVDQRMVELLIEKQEIIDAALDDVTAQQDIKLPPARRQKEAKSMTPRQERIAKVAERLTADDLSLIHSGLRTLAGRCDGARDLDGSGFSKIDTDIGHALADQDRLSKRQGALGAELIRKYRRQLPTEITSRVEEVLKAG